MIYVFGGTSDSIVLCRLLERLQLPYRLSVATEAGVEAAEGLQGEVMAKRLTAQEMQAFFRSHGVTRVIDATHPFAVEVSANIRAACAATQLDCMRYVRTSQQDALEHPLLICVADLEEACERARTLGSRVFLTTGSKDLAEYVRRLPNQRLIARVLPTANVVQHCADLGLKLGDIVAMKGPFSADLNRAMYTFYQPNVVITKESGEEGGYLAKVQPCLDAGIPCIVILRATEQAEQTASSLEEIQDWLTIAKTKDKNEAIT